MRVRGARRAPLAARPRASQDPVGVLPGLPPPTPGVTISTSRTVDIGKAGIRDVRQVQAAIANSDLRGAGRADVCVTRRLSGSGKSAMSAHATVSAAARFRLVAPTPHTVAPTPHTRCPGLRDIDLGAVAAASAPSP